jgi:predicted enzyme related to lactoylglutathione lyase
VDKIAAAAVNGGKVTMPEVEIATVSVLIRTEPGGNNIGAMRYDSPPRSWDQLGPAGTRK